MLHLAERLGIIANKVNKVSDKMHSVEHVAEDLNSEKHYLLEENVLFPILQKTWNHRVSFDNADGTQPDKRQKETTSKSS